MRNSLFLWSCLLLAIVSCKKESIDVAPYLRIPEEIKLLQYKQDAHSDHINIETNSSDWTISSNALWCKAERISDKQQMFRLTLAENEEPSIRQACLTFRLGQTTDSILVQQLGTTPAILLNPDSIEVESNGEEVEVIVTSNLGENGYAFVIPDTVSWIKEIATADSKALADYHHLFQIDSNPLTHARSATITVCGTGEHANTSVEWFIIQKGRSVETGDVEIEGDIKVVPTGGWASEFQKNPASGIENTFDGEFDLSKVYHSIWNQPANFPVILEYHFAGESDIDYLIYYPTKNGNGWFGKFKLYAITEGHSDYVKIGDYDFHESSSTQKISFESPLPKVTKIKFEIESGSNNFVSCSEMEFYKTNTEKTLDQQLLTVFKDITCCEVRDDVTDEKINALPGFFANLASVLRDGTLSEWEKGFRIRDYESYSHVEEWAEKLMTKKYSNLDNITGIYANAGEEVILLVGDTHGHSISVQCIGESGNAGAAQTDASGETFFLQKGVNKIQVSKTGMLFIMYTATPGEQPIRVHIPVGSGHVSGFFDLKEHQTDEKYKELLSKADYKYFGVRGDKIMFYFHTEKMKEVVPDQILSAIHLWDDIIGWQQELMGIEDVRPSQVNNHIFAISPETGYMWASDYRIGFVYSYLDNILLKENVMKAEDNAWGPAHEIGHIHQAAINWPGSTESSNNLFSNYIIYKLGKYKSRGKGLCEVAKARYEDGQGWWNMGDATHQGEATEIHLRMNWQLWNYFHRCGIKTDFWQQLFKELRANPVPESDPGRKQMLFARSAAKVANMDLTDFFDMWGFFVPVDDQIEQYGTWQYTVTEEMIEETKNYMATLPAPKHALQYIEDRRKSDFPASDYRYATVGDVGYYEQFKDNQKITKNISYTLSGRTVTISDGDEAVAFEWQKEGKVIFFSNFFEFTVPESISLEDARLYAVQANGERIPITKTN